MTALLMKTINARDSLAKIIRSSPYTLFHIPVTYYRMCGNCMERETHMNNKGSGLTPAQALDKLDAV